MNTKPVTLSTLAAMKQRGERIVALTCYDASFAALLEAGGVDVLLVRSVTRVDEPLLSGSAVKFVGTATSGFDHVDVAYLARNNIAFSHAPGSNANSVVEYVLAAIAAVFVDVRTIVNAVERDLFARHQFLNANVDCGESRFVKVPSPDP